MKFGASFFKSPIPPSLASTTALICVGVDGYSDGDGDGGDDGHLDGIGIGDGDGNGDGDCYASPFLLIWHPLTP
jgi:hypothetical protein